jgi:ribosomal protein L28
MKISFLLLCVFFASCTNVVYFRQPLPKHHKNISHFSDKLQGHYLVIDTVIDKELDVKNSMYSPQKHIRLDTTLTCIGKLEVDIFQDVIISKTWRTFYTNKSNHAFLENEDNEDKDLKVKYIGDTLKIDGDMEIDTIIDLKKQDIVRKFQKNYILNKFKDAGYQIVLLNSINDSIVEIRDLYKHDLLNYLTENENPKKYKEYDDAIGKEKAIDISNTMLRKLIKSNSFKRRMTLKKYAPGSL